VEDLTPRSTPWQRAVAHAIDVSPEPSLFAARDDAFGNPTRMLCIETDHDTLSVRARSEVIVDPRSYPEDASSPPWESVRASLVYQAGRRPTPADLDASRYSFESWRVRNKRELAVWTSVCFPPGAPVLVGVRALMLRIHREFAFDPTATTVSTPVMDVFARKRGVCQDFAHFMLSCLRSLGLSARYVSGYLLTRPPPGKPRLVGADASHAWVSVYCPGYGWVDADPTNGVFPSLEHVTLGWGRDYDDVIPLRGVLLGGGEHELAVEVTVVPAEEAEALLGQG